MVHCHHTGATGWSADLGVVEQLLDQDVAGPQHFVGHFLLVKHLDCDRVRDVLLRLAVDRNGVVFGQQNLDLFAAKLDRVRRELLREHLGLLHMVRVVPKPHLHVRVHFQ